MTPEQLKVLTDSVENLLQIQFPVIDNMTGLGKWEVERKRAIDILLNKIQECK